MGRQLCIIILLFFDALLYSQDVFLNYIHLNTDNGLNQNSVWNVLRTSDNYVWIGTSSGVTKWDGKNFTSYRYDESPSSLLGNTVLEFFEDNKRNLWIVHNKGLSVYNKYKDNFDNVVLNTSDFYCKILFSDGNKLFVLKDLSTICVIDIDTRRVIDIRVLPFFVNNRNNIFSKKINNKQYYSVVNSDLNKSFCLFMSENGDLAILNKDTVCFYKIGKHIQALFEKGKEEYIRFTEDSIMIYKISKDRISQIFKGKHELKIKNEKLIDYYYDTTYQQNILVTQDRIFTTDKNLKTIKNYSNFINDDNYREFFSGIYADEYNNIYVYTNTNGLFIFPTDKRKFISHFTRFKKFNIVKSICVTNDNKLITGQYSSWLTIYNGQRYDTINIYLKNVFPEILAIENYDSENILCVNSQCFFLFNHKIKKISYLNVFSPSRSNAYPSIKKKNKYLFFNVVDKNSNSYILRFNNNIDTVLFLQSNNITAFEWISSDVLLIGTNRHLIQYDLRNKKYINVKNFWVKTILKADNDFFIGTTEGLYRLNYEKNQYIKIHGLPDNLIYGIIQDKHKNLWVSHNRGISLINIYNQKVINYSIKDGLLSNEFNTGAYYQDNNGKIYFGGLNGVNSFYPERIILNRKKLNINIHQILINDDYFKFDSSINTLKHITLSYEHNTISLDFNVIDVSNTDKNQYQYFLEGYDQKPIYSDKKHFVRYTNIPPGTYKLHLNGTNSDGVWGNEKIIYLTITPPFWRTWWFFSISGFIFVGLLIGVQIFLRNIQKRKLLREIEMHKKVESERVRISRDLHDNVGARLAFLKNNIEWLLNNKEHLTQNNNELIKYLDTLSEYSNSVMISLKDTIWALHTSNVTILEIFDRLKDYCLYLKKHITFLGHIQFREDIKNDKLLASSVSVNIFRISQEAIHNAIKHSNASDIVILLTELDNGTYKIEISDNGIGFNIDLNRSYSHGINNMLERAKEANLGLNIQTSLNKGTIIEIII